MGSNENTAFQRLCEMASETIRSASQPETSGQVTNLNGFQIGLNLFGRNKPLRSLVVSLEGRLHKNGLCVENADHAVCIVTFLRSSMYSHAPQILAQS
jgi:hypothetical protein